jgi:hypothetical protein
VLTNSNEENCPIASEKLSEIQKTIMRLFFYGCGRGGHLLPPCFSKIPEQR